MLEHVKVNLADTELFDELVHNSLPEGGDLQIVTKDAATVGGKPCVCISFTVQLPDGSLGRAQCVTTLRNMMNALAVLRGRYGEDF